MFQEGGTPVNTQSATAGGRAASRVRNQRIESRGRVCRAARAHLSHPGPHSTPCTLHPTPYTLNSTHNILHPTPYTLHPTPYTLNPPLYTLRPTPSTPNPSPYTLHPTPKSPRPTPYTQQPTT